MPPLELGVQIPSWQWDYRVDELRDLVQAVEAIGYDFLFVADHVTYAYALPDRPAGRYAGPIPQHESLTFLATAAGWTSRVRLQPACWCCRTATLSSGS